MYQEITGVKPDEIPMHDDEVMKLFNSLDSLHIDSKLLLGESVGAFGIPEFGTGFVMQMLDVIKPQTFDDLIRISGLSHGTDV
jgi:DNA polymerase-3 subunit alpha (Gram-positive type)